MTETVAGQDQTPQKRGAREVNEHEWGRLIALWEKGGISADDLSDSFNINKNSMLAGIKKRGGVYGRLAAEEARQVAKSSADDFQALIQKANDTKREHYQYARNYALLAHKKVVQAEKGEISYAEADEHIKTLLNATKLSVEARKDRFAVLGLDRDDLVLDELPTLEITEMTNEDIEAIRRVQEARERNIEDGIELGELEEIHDSLEDSVSDEL